MRLVNLFTCLRMTVKLANAHIEMYDPPPIKSRFNNIYEYENVDYDYNNPLTLGEFPCKGYHIEEDPHPVYSYEVGEKYMLSLLGTATHFGGSCQVSLSYDEGETFQVIKSIIGGCPIPMDYDFTIPEYAPDGLALISWSWISNVGNRDFYQNCAWVDIVNDNDTYTEMQGPDMFVAQLPGTCVVPEGFDFIFPEPGPDTEYGGDPAFFTTICEPDSDELRQRLEQEDEFDPQPNDIIETQGGTFIHECKSCV